MMINSWFHDLYHLNTWPLPILSHFVFYRSYLILLIFGTAGANGGVITIINLAFIRLLPGENIRQWQLITLWYNSKQVLYLKSFIINQVTGNQFRFCS